MNKIIATPITLDYVRSDEFQRQRSYKASRLEPKKEDVLRKGFAQVRSFFNPENYYSGEDILSVLENLEAYFEEKGVK